MDKSNSLAGAGHHTLVVDDGRVAYDVQGEGPLLVLVPGMGELRSSYRFVVPALVAAGHRVVTMDLRGHGDSDADFASYGDADTARDIVALIDELGGSAVVVGNSMAAGAAVIAAASRPDLVAGLVLIGPFVRNPPSVSAFQRALFRVLMARPWAAASWNAYLPTLYRGRKPADFDEYRAAIRSALRRPGYGRAFSLTTRTDHAPAERVLGDVSVPTLVVMGTEDPDFPSPRVEADWVADSLGGQVVMIDEAGHYPQSQQPEATAAAILSFVQGRSERG